MANYALTNVVEAHCCVEKKIKKLKLKSLHNSVRKRFLFPISKRGIWWV
jgi:hypothetical protein